MNDGVESSDAPSCVHVHRMYGLRSIKHVYDYRNKLWCNGSMSSFTILVTGKRCEYTAFI